MDQIANAKVVGKSGILVLLQWQTSIGPRSEWLSGFQCKGGLPKKGTRGQVKWITTFSGGQWYFVPDEEAKA